MKILAKNRRAFYDYEIIEKYEAGLMLLGTEVKSAKSGHINISEAYVVITNEEAFLLNAHISEYKYGNIQNHEPRRTRKLLLKKRELRRLIGTTKQRGYTIIPLQVYEKKGWLKVEIAVGKGKRKYDKREKIKKREADREIERAMKWQKKGY